MYSKLKLSELKIPILKQNIIFFIKLTKVLEVNFRFLANFRFLTLPTSINHVIREDLQNLVFKKETCKDWGVFQ